MFACICCQLLCPAGRYGNETSLSVSDCSGPCAPGYECPSGSTVDTALICPPGYYCDGGVRQPCPAGRYSSANGTTSAETCTPCPAGTVGPTAAAVDVTLCVPCTGGEGSYVSEVECWPAVASATASNPLPVVPGLSIGDVVTVVFTHAVRTGDNASVVVLFSPPIGVVTYQWHTDGRVLVVTVQQPPANVSALLDAPLWTVTVSGAVSASGLSSHMPPQVVHLSGSWGDTTPPLIVTATAYDGGHNAGLGSRDTLTLGFDQAVNPVPVATMDAVMSVVRLTPPVTALCADVTMAGVWQAADTLVVTFFFPETCTVAPTSRWSVGALTVTAAGLQSAVGTSPPSNSTVVVTSGRCG